MSDDRLEPEFALTQRAWCELGKGPCENGCLGKFCLRAAMAPDAPPLPARITIDVGVVFCCVILAAFIGYIVGMSR